MTLAERVSDWEKDPPPDLYGDPMWRMPALRLGRFLADIARDDATTLADRDDLALALSQLVRSVESIAVNIAEGYSRSSGRDRARFYELALGSARETREWYRRIRKQLGEPASLERAELLTRVIKILQTAIPQDRAGAAERRMEASRHRTPRGPE